jgi:hypothetical protein
MPVSFNDVGLRPIADLDNVTPFSMLIGIAIGATSVLIGLALITTGQSMCRTTCWIDNVFRSILPESFGFLGNGLPAIVIGVAIIIHTVWSNRKR